MQQLQGREPTSKMWGQVPLTALSKKSYIPSRDLELLLLTATAWKNYSDLSLEVPLETIFISTLQNRSRSSMFGE